MGLSGGPDKEPVMQLSANMRVALVCVEQHKGRRICKICGGGTQRSRGEAAEGRDTKKASEVQT